MSTIEQPPTATSTPNLSGGDELDPLDPYQFEVCSCLQPSTDCNECLLRRLRSLDRIEQRQDEEYGHRTPAGPPQEVLDAGNDMSPEEREKFYHECAMAAVIEQTEIEIRNLVAAGVLLPEDPRDTAEVNQAAIEDDDSLPELMDKEDLYGPGLPKHWNNTRSDWPQFLVVAMNNSLNRITVPRNDDHDDYAPLDQEDVSALVATDPERALQLAINARHVARTHAPNMHVGRGHTQYELTNLVLSNNPWPENLSELSFDDFLRLLGLRHGLTPAQARTFAYGAAGHARQMLGRVDITLERPDQLANEMHDHLRARPQDIDTPQFLLLLMIARGLERSDGFFVTFLPDYCGGILQSHVGYLGYLLQAYPSYTTDPFVCLIQGITVTGDGFARGVARREGGELEQRAPEPFSCDPKERKARATDVQAGTTPPLPHELQQAPSYTPHNPFPWNEEAARRDTCGARLPENAEDAVHSECASTFRRRGPATDDDFQSHIHRRQVELHTMFRILSHERPEYTAMMPIHLDLTRSCYRYGLFMPLEGRCPQLPTSLPSLRPQSYSDYHRFKVDTAPVTSQKFKQLQWGATLPEAVGPSSLSDMQLASRSLPPQLNQAAYTDAQRHWFTKLPGTRQTSATETMRHSPHLRALRIRIEYDPEVLCRSMEWRETMERVHKFLLTKDEHTQELHHTLHAHGMHDLQPDYREIHGSGPEPYLGWDYFMNLFLAEHELHHLERHSTDLTLDEQREVLAALWPEYQRSGYHLGYNRTMDTNPTALEVHIVKTILTLLDANTESQSKPELEDWDLSLRFRHQRLAGLIRLFRSIHQAKRSDPLGVLAHSFLARYDGELFPHYLIPPEQVSLRHHFISVLDRQEQDSESEDEDYTESQFKSEAAADDEEEKDDEARLPGLDPESV